MIALACLQGSCRLFENLADFRGNIPPFHIEALVLVQQALLGFLPLAFFRLLFKGDFAGNTLFVVQMRGKLMVYIGKLTDLEETVK